MDDNGCPHVWLYFPLVWYTGYKADRWFVKARTMPLGWQLYKYTLKLYLRYLGGQIYRYIWLRNITICFDFTWCSKCFMFTIMIHIYINMYSPIVCKLASVTFVFYPFNQWHRCIKWLYLHVTSMHRYEPMFALCPIARVYGYNGVYHTKT